MSRRPLTTTSFAILGLLAIQPWATYDLAKLMRRSLHFFWPRARATSTRSRNDSSRQALPKPARNGTATDGARCTPSPIAGVRRCARGSRHRRRTRGSSRRRTCGCCTRTTTPRTTSSDDPVDRGRGAEDDRPLRPARDRVRTRRWAFPRSDPRQCAPRVALDRAGACRRALGAMVTWRRRDVGDDRAARCRMGCRDDAACCP